MAKITIEINEEEVAEMVQDILAKKMVLEYGYESREAKYGIRQAVEKAVKDIIYKRKDEMIERCVTKASTELVKKGLPKLIERLEV